MFFKNAWHNQNQMGIFILVCLGFAQSAMQYIVSIAIIFDIGNAANYVFCGFYSFSCISLQLVRKYFLKQIQHKTFENEF